MKSYGVTIKMASLKQFFQKELLIMLFQQVLTFDTVNETLWCDH